MLQKSERKQQWLLHTGENVLLWLSPGSSYKSMSCAVFKANVFPPIIELNNCPKQIDAWGGEKSKGNLRGCLCTLAVHSLSHHLPPPNLHIQDSTSQRSENLPDACGWNCCFLYSGLLVVLLSHHGGFVLAMLKINTAHLHCCSLYVFLYMCYIEKLICISACMCYLYMYVQHTHTQHIFLHVFIYT